MAMHEHIAAEKTDAAQAAAVAARNPQRTPMDPNVAAVLAAQQEREAVRNGGQGIHGFEDRVPFGQTEQQLAVPDRPGFRRYWFNDTPGRIARALRAGYAHVTAGGGENVSHIVGSKKDGGGLIAYLMEIPEEWYLADRAAFQELEDRKLAQIRTGKLEGATVENGYVDTSRTRISR